MGLCGSVVDIGGQVNADGLSSSLEATRVVPLDGVKVRWIMVEVCLLDVMLVDDFGSESTIWSFTPGIRVANLLVSR